MTTKTEIGRTAVFNWVTLAASLGVAFFLSPFIVRKLGSEGYGVWTLVNSLVAYMWLLDLGLRGAVTRFVSRYHAQGDHESASRAVSAAFWLRVWTGVAILVGALTLSSVTNTIVDVPADMHDAARWAVLIVGVSVAVTITLSIFGGVLAALHRFDLICSVTIVQTGFRAAGAVWLLRNGHGIVHLALWELTIALLGNLALMTLALRVYSELRFAFQRPDSTVLRQLGGYSFYVIVLNACHQVINYTDNIVVGACVGVAAVTIFSIAGGLLEYTRQTVSALGVAFLPLASGLDARGQHHQLRELLIQGTQAALLVALPIEVALFFRGHTFIGIWMGSQYALESGRVLRILLLSQVFLIADYTGYNIACGLGKHKPVAMRMLAEATANFCLSILLARSIGLVGVALGTVIPSVVNHLFFGPRYICKTLDMPVRTFLLQSWVRSALAVVPFAVACFVADNHWPATGLLQFGLQMMALSPLFVLGVVICFWKDVMGNVGHRSKWFFTGRPSRVDGWE